MNRFFLALLTLTIYSCKDATNESDTIQFDQPLKVEVMGYSDDIMEPFLSRGGDTLFFNNSNDPSVNTNLHFAVKVDDLKFTYIGEVRFANTPYLDGVPSVDNSNRFFFVSTRSYGQSLSTIYCGIFRKDSLTNVELVQSISKNMSGWVNFDAEISRDGNYLFFVDGRFDENGGPYEADFYLAKKENGALKRVLDNSTFINVNTSALEYAACLSSNMLELYFTRVSVPFSATSEPQIFVAIRSSNNTPFGKPYKINSISGFVEAPTISPDNRMIYYHKKEGGKYVLYMVRKSE
ncbi:MAG: hypothetical protein EHM93_00360 [Bacteroidales bacterium]|nr:MAG: hypothetical protein EHM93_00360 [Bacteroidales bacterium]